MLLRVQSPVLAPTRRGMIATFSAYAIWSCFLLSHSMAQPSPRAAAEKRPSKGFRFEVSESESNRPLPNATVRIVLWRHENGAKQNEELESRTDENGVAVFPSVQVEKLTVSVEAKGYRSDSRWINPKDFGQAIRIHLEKWRRVPK